MDIATKVERLKEDIERHVKEIEKLDSVLFRNLCLFSIAEQYAQDCANYKGGNSKPFYTFLNKYSADALIEHYDPVTLFYENQSGFLNKGLDLSYLSKHANPVTLASSIASEPETIAIISEAKNIIPDKCDRHKYGSLIYKYRSKLSHELHSPSHIWEDEQSITEPFYSYVTNLSIDSENQTGTWQLRLPYAYLKRIFVSTIHTYLDDCVKKNRKPFETHPLYLNWYEKAGGNI